MLDPSLYDALDPLAQYILDILLGANVAELPTRRVRHEPLEVDVGLVGRLGLAAPASMLTRATRLIDDGRSSNHSV